MQRKGVISEKKICADGMEYDFFWKDQISILFDKLQGIPSDFIITKPPRTLTSFSHPMNAEVLLMAVTLVEVQIKLLSHLRALRKALKHEGEKSFVFLLPIYTVKSINFLRKPSLIFYPVHITSLILTNEWSRKMISSGKCVSCYLSIDFIKYKTFIGWKSNKSRSIFFLALQEAIGHILEPLANLPC